jgi:hypothetical protein
MLATIDYFDTLLAEDEADYHVIVTRKMQSFINNVKKQQLQAVILFCLLLFIFEILLYFIST